MTTSFAEAYGKKAGSTPASSFSPSAVYVGHNRVLLRTLFGHKMFVDSRDLSLTPHLILDGYWEMWITRVFQHFVKPGMRVVEVGANVGYYTLLACQQIGARGSLLAFDANPSMAKIVTDNLNINGYSGIAKVICKAAYSEAATLSFDVFADHIAGSTLFIDEASATSRGDTFQTMQVEAVRIDDMIAPGERIDFIKIDAEGAELHVLQGAERVLRENAEIKLVVEHSPSMLAHVHPGSASIVFDYVTALGFQVFRIDHESRLIPSSFEQLAEAGHCDVVLSRRL